MDIFEYEQHFFDEGLEQLKPYLLSDEVFWALGLRTPKGQPPYPPLTLGNLLLTAAKLAARDDTAQARIKDVRDEWREAWARKAEKEFGVRLRQWSRFMADFGEAPERYRATLGSELRTRALLALLGEELAQTTWASEVAGLDARLRGLTEEGDFVWAPEIEAAFGREAYWFLYRQPKTG